MTHSLSTFKKLIFSCLAVGFLLVGAELSVRCLVRPPGYLSHPTCYSDYLPLTTPPNTAINLEREDFHITVRYDEHGFRVGQQPTPSTSHRSLYLGDSFVMGFGLEYEDTFVARLNERLQPNRTVLAAGYTGGYSPDCYYAYLVRNLPNLDVDEVVIFIYDDNDIDDISENVWLAIDERGAPTRLGTLRAHVDYLGQPLDRSKWNELRYWPVLEYSRLYQWAVWYGWGGPKSRDQPSKSLDQAFGELKLALRAIEELGHQHQVQVRWVVVPAAPRLRDESWSYLHAHLLKILDEALEAEWVDLLPFLNEADYLAVDAHFNVEGSRRVAQFLLERFYPNEATGGHRSARIVVGHSVDND